MIRSILVVGGGSAGGLAALILKKQMPDLPVTIVRSKEIGVIGVGESTTVAMPRTLHGYLELDPAEFYRRVQPSWKLGIRFLWGPRPYFNYTFDQQLDWKWAELQKPNGYYCEDDIRDVSILSALMDRNKAFERQANGGPHITRSFGYHIENRRFVAYLEAMALDRGIEIIDDVIVNATQDDHGITGVLGESGKTYMADHYIDCSGFRSLLLGKTLGEPFIPFKSTLFCDRAVVGTWIREEEPIQPYTTAETMTNGWCWRIDHPDCIMRGYVYSSSFFSDEDAKLEFKTKNPKVTDVRYVHFVTGRYERTWVKNVTAVGNSAGFVEPLESTALSVICDAARILAGTLHECDRTPTPNMMTHYNRLNSHLWDQIRDFLGIHYKFNVRFDTPFWRACHADTQLGQVQELIDYYQASGPSTFYRYNLVHGNDIFGLEGYLTLLVGQQVPYRARHKASADEMHAWRTLQAANRQKAESAYPVRDALDVVMLPQAKWVPGYFRGSFESQLTSYIGAKG